VTKINTIELADDPALAIRDIVEARAIATELEIRQTVTAYAIVTRIHGEQVTLVTRCKIGERATWRELLGLHLSHGAVEDLDANWGMAWVEPDGSMRMAGPNLEFARQAQDKLTAYAFRDGDTSLPMENTNTKHDAPFAFFGENDVEGSVCVDVEVLPSERKDIGELFGINPTDPWGMAWQPVTVTTAGDGTTEFEVHHVILATGTTVEKAYQAFAELAICQPTTTAGQH
jgi:hypothetical protein